MGVLDDKVAVVTGGAAGIGKAIASRFAREGARVVIADRDPGGRVAGEISGLAVTADVSVEDDVAALFEACETAFGRLDILVNNAGVVPPRVAAEDMTMADWDAVIAVNLRGVILCIKYGVRLLRRQGGAIVNMSSRVAFGGTPMQSHYSASKYAVRGITEAVAQEVGAHGIRVNSLCPGTTATERFLERTAMRARIEGRSPAEIIETDFTATAALRRVLQPDEIAEAALFLASDAAGAITGEHLKIDAGRL